MSDDIDLNLPLNEIDYSKQERDRERVRKKLNTLIIEALLNDKKLNSWELNFVDDMENTLVVETYNYSEKQEDKIDQILEKLI